METLVKRAKLFGISERDLNKALACTAKDTGISKDTVIKDLVEIFEYNDKQCMIARNKDINLKDYQEQAVKFMQSNRGLILSMSTGKGKTITAVSIIDCITRQAAIFGILDFSVKVVTPTSLVDNFKKEMRKFGMSEEQISRVSFYTIAKFGKDYKDGLISCKRTFLIVDEAHELRTDYRGEFASVSISKEDTRAEQFIECARNADRVLLLTATPTYNQVYDVVNLAAMIRGEYPVSGDTFFRMRTDPDLFQNYYGCIFTFERSISDLFPKRVDHPIFIIMTPQYLKNYEELEQNVVSVAKTVRGDEEAKSNVFLTKMRTASNELKPCLKCNEIIPILKKNQKTLIYSSFIESGIDIIKRELDNMGKKYLEITGKTAKARRQKIVDTYNDPKGPNFLIITRAAGTGLDLRGTRNIIILNPDWNMSSLEQVIGRGVRLGSHLHLPKKDQVVDVYFTLVIKPEDAKNLKDPKYIPEESIKGYKKSADLLLWEKSLRKQREAMEFEEELKAVGLQSGRCV